MLILFQTCQFFEFRHLPVSGGIYDQHPDVVESFKYILSELSKEEQRKSDRRERDRGGPGKINVRPSPMSDR